MDRKKIRTGKAPGAALIAALLAVLTLTALAPEADAKSRKKQREEEAAPLSEPAGAETAAVATPVAASPAAPRQRTVALGFKDMGALVPIQLRGVEGGAALPFSIRSDEVVVGARLKFNYSYSPSLIPELSHLKVFLNDEVVAAIPLPKEKNLANARDIELDPRLFADYNKLRFALIGHYTYRCEDPMHSSLWLSLSNLGRIELTLAPLALANDLKYLPVPFFDKRDNSPLNLPFVFASQPAFGSMKAAGVVASWFGGLASYRGARFPVSYGGLPNGNAVVFLQSGEKLAGLEAAAEAEVALVPHPSVAGAKLLLISGKNDEDLMRAARAVVLNGATFSGQRVAVTRDKEPPARKPYDAPAWVPVDRPVKFSELARAEDLDVRGYYPDSIKINFRVAPDLFTWRSNGVPMDLKYRFTRLPFSKNASLNVNANRAFLQAMALNDPARLSKTAEGLGGGESELSIRRDSLRIPPFHVGGRNQLQLQYHFDIVKEGDCRDSIPDNLQASVDPESTIDFSGFPRYGALPDLAHFTSIGFPYTKLADLSQTAVVMPERPNVDEVALYLTLMGRMGEATGYPVLRHAVIPASALDKNSDSELIVIGAGQDQPLMEKWADALPLVQGRGERRVREPDVFRRLVYRWAERDVQEVPRPDGSVSFKGAGDIAVMMAFESPVKAQRSAVFLYADRAADLGRIADGLNDAERNAQIQGDFVVFGDKTVSHFKVADTYYVGELPWTTHLRWFFSSHPLLAVALGALVSLLLAVMMYRKLRKIAAQRLGKKS